MATTLVLVALEERVTYFFSPSTLSLERVPTNVDIRLGGLVQEGSVMDMGGGTIRFVVTDGVQSVTAFHTGILPDLFREGQGVVATGRWNAETGAFVSSEILAKHDENYMPPEVADALRESGYMRDEE